MRSWRPISGHATEFEALEIEATAEPGLPDGLTQMKIKYRNKMMRCAYPTLRREGAGESPSFRQAQSTDMAAAVLISSRVTD